MPLKRHFERYYLLVPVFFLFCFVLLFNQCMRSGNAYYHREKNAITDEFDPRVHAAFPARRDRDYVVVGAVLCTKQLYCGSRVVFRMFLRILIFDPNWQFCNDYTLCIVANFSFMLFGNLQSSPTLVFTTCRRGYCCHQKWNPRHFLRALICGPVRTPKMAVLMTVLNQDNQFLGP